jgi:hypothetical protein
MNSEIQIERLLERQAKAFGEEINQKLVAMETKIERSLESKFQASNDFISSKLSDLETSQTEFKKIVNTKLIDLEMKVATYEKEISELKEARRRDEMAEKAANVVILGLKEVGSSVHDSKLSHPEFLTLTLAKIESDTGIKINESEVKETFRMGKFVPGRDRPLKLKFHNRHYKSIFMSLYLKRRMELMSKGLRIRDDLTENVRRFRSLVWDNMQKLYQSKAPNSFQVRFSNDSLIIIDAEKTKTTLKDPMQVEIYCRTHGVT